MGVSRKGIAYRNLDLDETGVVVSAVPCCVSTLFLANCHATAIRYVKFYNKATAADQNDTPVHTIPVGPTVLGGGLIQINLLGGDMEFSTGLSMRATTGVADSDTGAPSANDVVVNLKTTEYFK